jgi:hypothetical protein
MKRLRSLKKRLKAREKVKTAFAHTENPPVLIYQMGKVGSNTIHKSLKNTALSDQLLQLHFLSDDLAARLKKFKKAGKYPYADHFYISLYVRKALEKYKGKPIKIITLTRDPIAIVVSNLFQNSHLARKKITSGGVIDPEKATKYIQDIICKPDTFKYIFEWFNKEMYTVFSVDVFSEKFPVHKGYTKYTKGNIELLVIRLEDLSNIGPAIISDFLNLQEPVELIDDNLRSMSKDKSLYDKVLRDTKISPQSCLEIYSSDFVRHFYDDKYVNKFMSKWTKTESVIEN